MELIRLENAAIGYDQALLTGIDLSIAQGERLAILGPNGAGKSTLVKSLIGLIPLRAGRRVLGAEKPLRIGYVPQAHRADTVFPLRTEEVVLQGRLGRLRLGRPLQAVDRKMALAQLDRIGLRDKAQHLFRSLSGGQRQRVLLARALCGEPELLVLDEFTSDMDPAASAALLSEVSQLAQNTGVSVVFVTHEISAAASHATQVAIMDARRQHYRVGPANLMLQDDRLSELYGQKVHIERRDGRITVFIESGGEG